MEKDLQSYNAAEFLSRRWDGLLWKSCMTPLLILWNIVYKYIIISHLAKKRPLIGPILCHKNLYKQARNHIFSWPWTVLRALEKRCKDVPAGDRWNVCVVKESKKGLAKKKPTTVALSGLTRDDATRVVHDFMLEHKTGPGGMRTVYDWRSDTRRAAVCARPVRKAW